MKVSFFNRELENKKNSPQLLWYQEILKFIARDFCHTEMPHMEELPIDGQGNPRVLSAESKSKTLQKLVFIINRVPFSSDKSNVTMIRLTEIRQKQNKLLVERNKLWFFQFHQKGLLQYQIECLDEKINTVDFLNLLGCNFVEERLGNSDAFRRLAVRMAKEVLQSVEEEN